MKTTRGFTLIELLVVIAVVAILAAMLFPLFGAAKERGRQVKCLGNLKQLTTAFLLYVDDHSGLTPRIAPYCIWPDNNAPNWCGTLVTFGRTDVRRGSFWKLGYVRSEGVFICPTDIGREATGLTDSSMSVADRKAYPLSYSLTQEMNQRRSGSNFYLPVNFYAAVAGKSRKVLLFEHESRVRTQYAQGINDGLNLWFNNLDKPDKVHYNGTTVSYADGHATWQSFDELERQKYAGDWTVHGSTYPAPIR
ncbi:MAG: prepilin-type N-terminal cleavage/methylation domain-containing protein [Armatimonadota bacterium]